jgi:hypothetical protein
MVASRPRKVKALADQQVVLAPRTLIGDCRGSGTAARNLIRAGVPQHVVMKLRGCKTDAMFRGYAIVDERDLRDAVELLAKETTGDNL